MDDLLNSLDIENDEFQEINCQFELERKQFISFKSLEKILDELEYEYEKECSAVKNYKEELNQENIKNKEFTNRLEELKIQINENKSQYELLNNEEFNLEKCKKNIEKKYNSKQIERMNEQSNLIKNFKKLLGLNWDFMNINKQNLCGYIINKRTDYIKYFSGIDSSNIDEIFKEIENGSHGDWNQFL